MTLVSIEYCYIVVSAVISQRLYRFQINKKKLILGRRKKSKSNVKTKKRQFNEKKMKHVLRKFRVNKLNLICLITVLVLKLKN